MDPLLTPLLKTTQDYLEAAGKKLKKKHQTSHVRKYGLELLGQLLGEVRNDLVQHDAAEVAVVYDILAEQVAELLRLPVEDAFRSLVQVCEDEDAQHLLRGQPVPDPEQVNLLRRWLVWATVTYQASPGLFYQRIVEIVYAPDGAAVSRKIPHVLDWDDIPDQTRERLTYSGQHAVRYQLYPVQPKNPQVD